jgi:DNA-binding NarL/FixJ family response regulator
VAAGRHRSSEDLELTEEIKKLHPHIMIIILTNYDLPEYREAAARCKADYFFSKGSMNTEEVIPLVKSRFCQNKGCNAEGPETNLN